MSRIAILGAGAWGTALSLSLARRGGHELVLWAHSAPLAEQLNDVGENLPYLPGFTLPADIPAWLAVIGVCFVYHFVSWPLKVMRRSLWRSHGWHGGLAGPLDGIVWLALFLGMVWFADHSSPAFHTWLQDLPPAIHHTVADVKEWWARR